MSNGELMPKFCKGQKKKLLQPCPKENLRLSEIHNKQPTKNQNHLKHSISFDNFHYIHRDH